MKERSRQKKSYDSNIEHWEIIVRNLPQNFYKEDLTHYLWKSLDTCRGLIKHGNPITQSEHVKQNGNHLRMRFRSFQQAINCLFLDRLYYGKKVLSITSNYLQRPQQSSLNLNKLKIVSRSIYDELNKIYVGNFPYMPDYLVMNYLSEYGQLKSYVEIEKDKSSSECFCQFMDSDRIQDILREINNLKVKGRPIIAKRATFMNTSETNKTKFTSKAINMPNLSVSSRFQKDLNEFYATFDTDGFFSTKKISCILLLKDIIPASYINNPSYIIGDIKEQVQRIGPLQRITHKNTNIYIEYQKVEYSQIAYLLLSNRKYDNKTIQISFYDPIKFADDILI